MSDRTAIITGASSGIGRASAVLMAKAGLRLVLNGRNEQKLRAIVEEVGEDLACAVCGDIRDPEITEACIRACQERWHRMPDVFLASAGRGLPGTLLSSDVRQWDDLIDTNIRGLLYQLKAIAKIMKEQAADGRDFVSEPMDIIVVGSSIGRNVSPFNSVYGATKFATHGLTEALRRQLGPDGIRVTLIEPGLVRTNFQQAAGYDQEWFGQYAKEVGPILEAEDIARVIVFLLSLPGNVHMDNISIRPTRQSYP